MGIAVKKTPLTINAGEPFRGYQIIPIWMNYDTPGENVQISKPAKTQMCYLVGIEGVKGAAYNPIFKSNTSSIFKLELAANSGLSEAFCPQSPRIICNTQPGEPLILNCDVALPPFLMYIVEA